MTFPESAFLLFYSRKISGSCVHRHAQLGGFAVRSVNDVPQQVILLPVPFENVKHRGIGFFLKQLVATVLLSHGKGLVSIDFEKLDIKNLGAGIRGDTLFAGPNLRLRRSSQKW